MRPTQINNANNTNRNYVTIKDRNYATNTDRNSATNTDKLCEQQSWRLCSLQCPWCSVFNINNIQVQNRTEHNRTHIFLGLKQEVFRPYMNNTLSFGNNNKTIYNTCILYTNIYIHMYMCVYIHI